MSGVAQVPTFELRNAGACQPRANELAKQWVRSNFTAMENSQLMQYLPVLMLGLLAVGFSFGMLVLSVALGKKGKRTPIKDTPYECGMLPIGEGSTRLSVKFYLVAMLFILFDIEVVFLYPWAVIYRSMLKDHGGMILGSMVSFMAILFVGYIYAVKKRAFDWKS
jgi:NADH-quinone oxidoreductase subunit A